MCINNERRRGHDFERAWERHRSWSEESRNDANIVLMHEILKKSDKSNFIVFKNRD